MVSGWPSDHFRFGLRVTLTSNVLPSGLTVTPPLSMVGIDAARAGRYLPCESMVMNPRLTGESASNEVKAVVVKGFNVSGACHSPATRVPPGTPGPGL